MGAVAARRAVIRWALRLFRREWRQQVLVTALVTVAVGAAVFAATAAYNTSAPREGLFGSASHRLSFNVSKPEAVDAYVAAADDWFGTAEVIRHQQVPVPGSTDVVELRAQDPSGPYGRPMLAVRSGRLPEAANEVALTDRAASSFDVDVGDTTALDDGEREVVGMVENPADLDDEFALVPSLPDETLTSITILVSASEERIDSFVVAEEPGIGFISSRSEGDDTSIAVLVFAVATVAMVLVSLVAAAAFVAVAQRRLRQLGMLAAVGATPRHLRLVMITNGAAVGVVAAIVGSTLAVVGWLASASQLEAAAGHRIDRFNVPWWLLAAGFVLAVVTATVAAWWPARTTARVPIARALSARPALPKGRHRSALLAGLLLVVGVAGLAAGNNPAKDETTPLLFIPGIVATVVAVLFIAPSALRALAVLGTRAPVAVRLALRDLARYQARAGAALAAISLGLGIAVAVIVVAAANEYRADEGNLSDHQLFVRVGTDARADDFLVPDPSPGELDELEAAVNRMVRPFERPAVVPLDVAVDPTIEELRNLQPVHPVVELSRPVGPETHRVVGRIFVATPELLTYLGVEITDPDTLVLTSQSDDVYLSGGISNTEFRRAPVPAATVERIDAPAYTSAPRSVLTEAGLREGGWERVRAGWLIETPEPLTQSQMAAARAIAADSGLTVETRSQQDELGTVRNVASIAGVLLALAILAMTVGLIRGDAAGDLRTLTATGATSSIRRALTASTAGALALLGVVLGTTAAYIALIAGYWPDTGRLSQVPLAHLVATAIALPLLAIAAGWLLARREPAVLTRPAIE